MASLSESSINLDLLQSDARKELLDVLDTMKGAKCVIMDTQVGILFQQVFSEIRTLNIAHYRDLHEGPDAFGTSDSPNAPENIVFLIRPFAEHAEIVNRLIAEYSHTYHEIAYHICFIPGRSVICTDILDNVLQLANVKCYDVQWGFVAFDTDLLLLQYESAFRDRAIDGDNSSVGYIAQSLFKIQDILGVSSNLLFKGSSSKRVVQSMAQLKKLQEASANASENEYSRTKASEIDTIIIMDREVDLVTPFIVPLTYEALIDYTLGIQGGNTKVDASFIGQELINREGYKMIDGSVASASSSSTPVSRFNFSRDGKAIVPLNSNDILFSQIRSRNIDGLGSELSQRAMKLQRHYEVFKNNKDSSIHDIKEFVKSIPSMNQEFVSLQMHINIAEMIKRRTASSSSFREKWMIVRSILEGENQYEYIENLLLQAYPDDYVFLLSAICLVSLTCGGIKSSKFDLFRRLFIQAYGTDKLIGFSQLQACGLLSRRESSWVESSSSVSSVWTQIVRQFELLDESSARKDDISYVSSGYAPISIRLLERLAQVKSWSRIEMQRLLPGPVGEVTQSITRGNETVTSLDDDDGNGLAQIIASRQINDHARTNQHGKKKRNLLFVMIGGLTYMELAACRFLSESPNFPYTILCATTSIISAKSMLSSIFQPIPMR